MMKLSHSLLFTALVLLAVLLRFPSFAIPVMDHDESTYMVMAKALAEGATLYEDVTDTKPPGIFWLFRLFYQLVGNSIIGFRVISAFFVAATAFLIALIVRHVVPSDFNYVWGGVVYVVLLSTYCNFGIDNNAEVYMLFFTALGAYFFIRNKSKSLVFLSGMAFSAAFFIKYIIVFDYAAIALIVLWYYRSQKPFQLVWLNAAGFLTGLFISLLILVLNGNLSEFYNVFVSLYFNHVSVHSTSVVFKLLKNVYTTFYPIIYIGAGFLFLRYAQKLYILKVIFLLWLFSDLVSLYMLSQPLMHYALQLCIPISLMAGLAISHKWFRYRIENRVPISIVLLVPLLVLGIKTNASKKNYRSTFSKAVNDVALYLEQNMEEDDQIFNYSHEQILYFMLDKSSPTKYVHKSQLHYAKYARLFNFNQEEELNAIFSKKIEYVITNPYYYPDEHIASYLEDYKIDTIIPRNIHVYKRKEAR